jgi:hypothetical protein
MIEKIGAGFTQRIHKIRLYRKITAQVNDLAGSLIDTHLGKTFMQLFRQISS